MLLPPPQDLFVPLLHTIQKGNTILVWESQSTSLIQYVSIQKERKKKQMTEKDTELRIKQNQFNTLQLPTLIERKNRIQTQTKTKIKILQSGIVIKLSNRRGSGQQRHHKLLHTSLSTAIADHLTWQLCEVVIMITVRRL